MDESPTALGVVETRRWSARAGAAPQAVLATSFWVLNGSEKTQLFYLQIIPADQTAKAKEPPKIRPLSR